MLVWEILKWLSGTAEEEEEEEDNDCSGWKGIKGKRRKEWSSTIYLCRECVYRTQEEQSCQKKSIIVRKNILYIAV